jgi:type I restriction enzyme R subunit
LFEGKPAALASYFDALWAQPMEPTDQDRLLVSLLTPGRLLEFLRSYVLFDRKVGKIVARYQQFFGIRALLARIQQLRPDGGREGGVVWHTTGSGKSFTMVFLTKALLLVDALAECRVVVVTDRVDLEGQLSRNFISGGAFGSAIASLKDGEKSRAMTGRDLARRIGSGTERITFTLVHKFNSASKLPECRNPSPNLIVLVDEGHRSHGGETHERMKKALPRAAYIAFTGTPLLKDEKTSNKFGPIVHAYTMQRAVEDETVAPLLYEERVPELTINEEAVNRWFDKITAGLSDAQRGDLKKKFAKKGAIYGAAGRIELIAWDIATHFSENIKKLDLGLKGQVATDSKLDAIRYKQALDDTGLVTSAIVISPPDTREGNAEVDEDKLPEVQKWWKQTVLSHGLDAETYEKQVVADFGTDDGPDLLIVVDKLLTGFDEPRNTVLYIDKPLKGHNLIQAVARVNRLHDDKRYGVLVDYRGILKELDTAIRAYQDLETRTQGGFDVADIEGLYRNVDTEYKRLPGLHDRMWSFFKGVANKLDREQFRQVLSAQVRESARRGGVRRAAEAARRLLRRGDGLRPVPADGAVEPELLRGQELLGSADRPLQGRPALLHRAAHDGPSGRDGGGGLQRLRGADPQAGRQAGDRQGSPRARRRVPRAPAGPGRGPEGLVRGEDAQRDRPDPNPAAQDHRAGPGRRSRMRRRCSVNCCARRSPRPRRCSTTR